MLLGIKSEIKVIGEAADCAAALDIATREQPDIILLDLDLNGVLALDCLADLRAVVPAARILILTGTTNSALHQLAVERGVAGLVLKQHATESLIKAIKKVNAGEVWFARTLMAKALARFCEPVKASSESIKISKLSKREREIIALICTGLNNKQLADRLFLSETTVRHHLTSIFAKLEVKDRLGLAIYAFEHNLIRSRHF